MSSSFKAQIDPLLMKQLIQKSNSKGILHFGTFFIILIGFGILSFQLKGTYWFFPFYLIYAIIFAFSEAAAHELNHDSVFSSRWLNTVAHWWVCFMSWREPIYSKYRHLRHHSRTSVIGEDPEGEAVRPKSIGLMLLEMLTRFFHAKIHFGAMLRHSCGKILDEDQNVVPRGLHQKMIIQSRIFLAGYIALIVFSMILQTWLIFLYLVLPRSLGTSLHDLCSRTQHTALAVNNPDYRKTTRTILLGPILRFLYWNMNFHIEHHLFQNVPFYALPFLHKTLKPQLPQPPRSLMAAWKEIFPALMVQRKNPNYFLEPILPVTNL
jgi:fatty acid desaturase